MQPTQSKRVFKLADFASTLEASNAAQDYCGQFNKPWGFRNSAPLIMYRYSKDHQGYIVEPNMNYYPNPAWNDLVKHETELATD